MGGQFTGIAARGTLLHRETLEAEQFLAKDGKLLGGNLSQEKLRRVTGIVAASLDFLHLLHILLFGDADGATEIGGIHSQLFLHHDHDVVGGFVENHQLTLAVLYQTARRVLDFLAKSIGIRVFLILIAENLQVEKAQNISNRDYHSHGSDYIFTIGKIELTRHDSTKKA